jgi:hypothetical protein
MDYGAISDSPEMRNWKSQKPRLLRKVVLFLLLFVLPAALFGVIVLLSGK